MLGRCLPPSRKKSTWGSQYGRSDDQSKQLRHLCCPEQRRSPISSPDDRAGNMEQKRMEHSPRYNRTRSAPVGEGAGACRWVVQKET